MSASDYVATYLNIWSWINDTFMPVQVLNYLQSGKGAQSGRAETAFSNLLGQLPALAGLAPGTGLPDVFQVQGNQYVRNSLRRVYWGKGAPDEIQNALWLASQCGLVDENSLATYVSSNLGVDCGGFVANYWGIGKPSVAGPSATGWAGFLPRYFWNNAPQLRRADPTQISVDDAAVFFSGVINEDPSIPAQQDPNSPGSYIDGTGSQAFHIGVVSQVNAYGDGTCDLNISEFERRTSRKWRQWRERPPVGQCPDDDLQRARLLHGWQQPCVFRRQRRRCKPIHAQYVRGLIFYRIFGQPRRRRGYRDAGI